jgi:MFS family permease
VAATQSLIVATVLPAAGDGLHIGGIYPLLFTAYSLAELALIPVAGWLADRHGAGKPYLLGVAVTAAGLALSACAVQAFMLLAGRILEGAGAGLLYTATFGTVARHFPSNWRNRIIALNATMWVVPALAGPQIGAAITSAWGWRYAFAVFLPVLLGAAAVVYLATFRHAGELNGEADRGNRLPLGRTFLCVVGSAGTAAGVTWIADDPIPAGFLAVISAAIVVFSARGLVPNGTFRAKAGLPACVAASFLLNGAFFAVHSQLTLMMVHTLGTSLRIASLPLTTALLAWTAASVAQPSLAGGTQRRTAIAGTTGIAAGLCGLAVAFATGSVALAVIAWTFAGTGMGLAYPSITSAGLSFASGSYRSAEHRDMAQTTPGQASAAILIASSLGTSLWTALFGAIISSRGGLHQLADCIAIGVTFVITVLCIVAASRLRVADEVAVSRPPQEHSAASGT